MNVSALNSIFFLPGIKESMYSQSIRCSCVKLNLWKFEMRIKINLLCIGWYSTCVKRHFVQHCSLRLYVWFLPWHSSCLILNFAHTCSLIWTEFSLTCNLLYPKMNFTYKSHVKLDVIVLSSMVFRRPLTL